MAQFTFLFTVFTLPTKHIHLLTTYQKVSTVLKTHANRLKKVPMAKNDLNSNLSYQVIDWKSHYIMQAGEAVFHDRKVKNLVAINNETRLFNSSAQLNAHKELMNKLVLIEVGNKFINVSNQRRNYLFWQIRRL